MGYTAGNNEFGEYDKENLKIMRVLFLANNDTGLYKFRKELLEELITPGSFIKGRKAQPCEVFISLPDGEFIPELKKLGCKYIHTNIDRRGVNPATDLKLLGNYRTMIKRVKPDIVFGYTIKPNIYGGMACAENDIPYVCNITGLGTAVENKGILQFITLTMYRFALRKAKTVFFQNAENEFFFTDHALCIGKHKMLPGSGVNLDYYKPMEYPGENTIEFAFVARIMKEKGIDQYIDAAEYIRKKYPNTKFHICGFCEESYEEEIRELENQGIIVYHGLVSDMREIYTAFHCTVHPTYYPEGLSNVLLESAASGRPIITTNRPGCREVIEDGRNGYLVKEQDSDDLIDKIEKFIALSWEEKKQMGLNGRNKVEKEFDRKIVIAKYIEEVEKCVHENQ